MDEKTAWQHFQYTGSVEAYLDYCKAKHEHDYDAYTQAVLPPQQQEGAHADPYQRPGYPGEQRGGK